MHADSDEAQGSVRELKDPVGRGSGLDPRPYEGYRGRINDFPGHRIGDHAPKDGLLLAVHASQFNGEKLEWIANMVASNAENYGDQAGVGMAEGFRCYR